MQIQKRELVLAIILSIVTCGIYMYYWMYKITEESNYLSEDNSINPTLAIVLSIVTCGIYMYYWMYKVGKNLETAQSKSGMVASDNSILYLILAIVGLSIVSFALMQDSINKIIDSRASSAY